MTTKSFEGKTLYRYLSLTKEDKEDLENFSEWSGSNNRIAAQNYIDSNAHKRDHRLLYLFKNKKLYRTTPSGFNDPYDCLVEIDQIVNDTDLLNWFRMYHGNQSFDSEEWEKLGRGAEKYLTNNNSIDSEHKQPIIDLLKSTLQKLVNRSRVVCFSENGENLLMWAHYADKHSGYCLTFDAKKLKGKNVRVGLYEVDYIESRPFIILSPGEIGSNELAKKILLTKSLHWCYEKEVRLIWNDQKEYFDFQESLTGIIFGAKMPPECQKGFQFLVETLNESTPGNKIEIKCAELDPRKYEVNLRACNLESS